MAAVLDINILCKKLIDFNAMQSVMKQYEVAIKSITSIDDWTWSNEQYIEHLNKIATTLERNKIIIIQLEKSLIKDLGIYIERIDDFYLYTLWINTEGYPQLDCDIITPQNQNFYNKICEEILKIEDDDSNMLKVMGSGVETDFFYSRQVEEIVRKSKNMIIWLVSGNDIVDLLKGYKRSEIPGTDKIVLEKCCGV